MGPPFHASPMKVMIAKVGAATAVKVEPKLKITCDSSKNAHDTTI